MQRGSALIDTLMAVAVMAMGVLGFSSASLHMNALGKAGLAREAASGALQREAQVLRAADFDSLPGRDGEPFREQLDIDHDGQADDSLIRVTEEQPGLLVIDLSLQWGARASSRAHQRLLVTNRRSLGE
ncbi:MAG: hypothetical protein U1E76_28460 [Planctomycetota bacterium]